jgi:hypothetical protein
MKNIFVFFLLSSGIITAQVYNYAYHAGTEKTYNMVGINTRAFYLEKSLKIPYCCGDQISLVGTGSNGQEIFRKGVAAGAYMQDCRVAVTADQHLLTSAGTIFKGCDYPGISYSVCKVDTTGSIIWNLQLKQRVEQILPWHDAGFFLLSGDELSRYTSTGQLADTCKLGIVPVHAITKLLSGNILVSYSGNGSRLRVIDTAGTMISDMAIPSALTDIQENQNGSIFALSGSVILKFSPAYNFLYSTAGTLPGDFIVKAFACRNDSVFAAGTASQDRPFYVLLDSALMPLHQMISNVENAYPTGIYPGNNNRVNLITWGATGKSPSQTFTGFFQTPFLGQMDARHDVGVKGISVLEAKHTAGGVLGRNGYVNAMVCIQNFGADTVRSFRLNHYVYITGSSYCLIGLNKKFSAVIPPGDSVTVETGFFNTRPFHSSYLNPDESYDYELCIYTSVPDSTNDIDVSNDVICQNIRLLPVGLREQVHSADLISVYPNPSSSGITIQAGTIMNRVELTDLSGRLLERFEPNDQQFFMNHTGWSPGLYLLRIYTTNGINTRKVMLE